jgi:Fe2+ transport system protein FeoA
MNADKLKIGQQAIVITCSDQQMMDIGFVTGERLKVIQILPFNGPKAVTIGASTFAVRNEELATVEVQIEE